MIRADTSTPLAVNVPLTTVFSGRCKVGAALQLASCTTLNGAAYRWISLALPSLKSTDDSDSSAEATVGPGDVVGPLLSTGSNRGYASLKAVFEHVWLAGNS